MWNVCAALLLSAAAVTAAGEPGSGGGITYAADMLKAVGALLVAILAVLGALLYTPAGRKVLLDAVVTALLMDDGTNVQRLLQKVILPELKKDEYKLVMQQILGGVDPLKAAMDAVKSAFDFSETVKKLSPPAQPPGTEAKEQSS